MHEDLSHTSCMVLGLKTRGWVTVKFYHTELLALSRFGKLSLEVKFNFMIWAVHKMLLS